MSNRILTLADGRLTASVGGLLTAHEGHVTLACHNQGRDAQTVRVSLRRSAGAARRVAQGTLVPGEQLLVEGLALEGDDVLLGQADQDDVIDYVLTVSGKGPFSIRTLSAEGDVRKRVS